ncbi:MAG TPA: glutathione S-transferase family protein [Nitrosomonas sp.]|nr:glutathione S-transferase family protein [Nitrosomonas sp.]HMW21785.1 glutathione S-transferase family protein [Nitrosomonas sp.]HMW69179.1 glutathione S-transferase family protein [Nitrosomonas sp.]HMY90651.1 glutathione S-transferase family protein [Nitrosomonas sp.]HNA71675.1 glutathione S-transferase family protein [Nitrosomonas sp.]
MITLYGIEWSRAKYVLFTLAELGLDYQHIKINPFEDEKNTPEYLKLNPLGQVPTLVDGDLVLTEAMAINFYLARKYGNGKLWINRLEAEALIYKWTFFAITQLEAACVDLILHRKVYDVKDRNIAIVREAEQKLVKPLRVLNEYLTGKDFLVADQFTVADINLAGVLSYAQGGEFDFSPYSKVAQYLEVVLSRPTYKKTVAG